MITIKRLGLIDNLCDIDNFRISGFENANSEEILIATGGNTGNVAFVYGIQKLLSNPISRIEWDWSPNEVQKKCDLIVVCCANQLGSHVDLKNWAQKIASFKLPVVLIGLGAQSNNLDEFPEVPPGTLEFLRTVQDLRPNSSISNISTRGMFTSNFLKSIGYDSTPTGCPSSLISPDTRLGKNIFTNSAGRVFKKIAIAAGNPWHKNSSMLEPILMTLADSYQGEFFVQHPKIMLQLSLGEWEEIPLTTKKMLLDIYKTYPSEHELIDWFRKHSSVLIDVPNWIRRLKNFDAIIGPRFHGVLLGVQAGIPGRVISIDSRTAELAESSGVPEFSVSTALKLSPEELVSSMCWSLDEAEQLDRSRNKSAQAFKEFFLGNGLEESMHLKQFTL